MNKKKKILVIGLLIGFCLIFTQGHNAIFSKDKDSEDVEKQMRLFSETYILIKENYVEEISAKDLIYGAIDGMVDSLDSYSQFMEPDVAKIVKSDTKGEFGGLGIRITKEGDYITVVTPLPETPAFRQGVLPGDKIVKIEGEAAKGISLRDAVNKLRGKVGTKVNITIAREDEEELLEFTITRGKIVPRKVYSKMLDNDIGYIRLVEFTEDAPDKLKKALKELKNQGMQGLIFDIRNNPGGLLGSAVDITDIFVEKGSLIVYTKGRKADQNRRFYASDKPVAGDIPLVVLINKGSASGSEIMAGCMKDISRGIIIGEQTFGKASVQSIIDLEDGSSLRLTTAKYYTPSGNLIHGEGITPDIKVALTKEQRIQIAKQQEKIYKLSEEEKKEREEHRIADPQLERAHDILVARKIFLKNGQKIKK
ncbi:MAG: S41 family peptidase [Elusimicrobiota bacterium]